jgi:Tfp pilus assembly protein PilF
MKLRLFVWILLGAALCLAQAPPASHKPLSQDEILELTRNYVPSQRLADLVHQYGINFAPGEDFFKALRDAGAEEVLITALRAAKPVRPPNATASTDARDAQLKQILARGVEFRKQKQYAQAEEQYRSALQLDPDRADIHFALGYVLLEQKKWGEAIAENREALRLRPEIAAAHNNLGLALSQQGNLEEAQREYREALRIRPRYALAHHNLGRLLEKEGNLEAAAREYRAACQLEPNNPSYRASCEKLPAPAARAERAPR